MDRHSRHRSLEVALAEAFHVQEAVDRTVDRHSSSEADRALDQAVEACSCREVSVEDRQVVAVAEAADLVRALAYHPVAALDDHSYQAVVLAWVHRVLDVVPVQGEEVHSVATLAVVAGVPVTGDLAVVVRPSVVAVARSRDDLAVDPFAVAEEDIPDRRDDLAVAEVPGVAWAASADVEAAAAAAAEVDRPDLPVVDLAAAVDHREASTVVAAVAGVAPDSLEDGVEVLAGERHYLHPFLVYRKEEKGLVEGDSGELRMSCQSDGELIECRITENHSVKLCTVTKSTHHRRAG